MTPSDSGLIARALVTDDRNAFCEIVRRHQSAVRNFLRRLTRGQHALADDLAQETFIEAYRNLSRFRGNSELRTWICGIAYNRFRTHLRASRESMPIDALDPAELPVEPSHVRSVEIRADVSAAIARLPPEEQAALHFCYTEGLSHEEAATVLGWPLGTLKTHVLRGKESLKAHLRSWDPKEYS